MECSDSRSPLPTRFVAFACRYHPRPRGSLPSTTRATPKDRGLLLFASLSPLRPFSDGDDRASQVPGEPLCTCPVLRPRRDLHARPYGASVRPSAFRTASAPAIRFFRGSMARPAHPLSTLRRADHSAATQDSLPAAGQALPDRMLPPARFQRKVSAHACSLSASHPPFPSFLDASETKPSYSDSSTIAAIRDVATGIGVGRTG